MHVEELIRKHIREHGQTIFSGPYAAEARQGQHFIGYSGQRLYQRIVDIGLNSRHTHLPREITTRAIERDSLRHLRKIECAISHALLDYFDDLGALTVSIPSLDFLAEKASSLQSLYLRLHLLLDDTHRCVGLYRTKDYRTQDIFTIDESRIIEFQGHLDLETSMEIAEHTIHECVSGVLLEANENIGAFLARRDLDALCHSTEKDNFTSMNLAEARAILARDTDNARYSEKQSFALGRWDHLRLTQIVGKHVWLHDDLDEGEKRQEGVEIRSKSSFLLLHGYGEVGNAMSERPSPNYYANLIADSGLELSDFVSLLATKDFPVYQPTAGFQLIWESLIHWMLKLPTLQRASQLPRRSEAAEKKSQ